MSPTVSAIIPVFNSAHFLDQALRSVFAQTHPVSEVIVVDDGSMDDPRAVIQAFKGVRYIVQKNSGSASARNHGAKLASSEFLAFLDADDLWTLDKTAHQIAAVTDSPLDAIFGHAEQFAETGQSVPQNQQIMPAELPSAMLIRRNRFEELGGYPEALRVGEVIAWLATARARGLRSRILPEVVYRRRIHANNTTRQTTSRAQYLSAVRAALTAKNGTPSPSGRSNS